MSEEWQTYVKDPRKPCKYASKCYQKNPEHHKTYKHPPENTKRKIPCKTPKQKRFKPAPRDSTASHKEDTNSNEDINENDEVSVQKDEKKNDTGDDAEVCDSERVSPLESKKERVKPSTSFNVSNIPQNDVKTSCKISLPENITYHDKNADHEAFKDLFLVEMPQDFFHFYEWLEMDGAIEKALANANLELIGPYDLLLGKLPLLDDKELYLIHWRFFYDPPEFQAVLKKKGKSQLHIGYFRDDPGESPVFVASSDSAKDCHITPIADNIFGAVYLYLQKERKSSLFAGMACQRLMEMLKKPAEMHNYSLEPYNMKNRLAQTVTKTFHGAGIVVPYNKKTQLGYRALVETDVNLKKLFAKLEGAELQSEKDKILSDIQPMITYANIAVDECDFGTGLEAGINLFCSGLKELQQSALSSLTSAYSLLNREAFGKIIQAHIKYRRRGPNMSVLSTSEV